MGRGMLAICWSFGLCAATALADAQGVDDAGQAREMSRFQTGKLVSHIERLASDEFEGRLPASKGEELTVNYLAEQFEHVGLKPGNTNDSWFQQVPLNSITADPAMELGLVALEDSSNALTLSYKDDEFMAWTKRFAEQVSVRDSEVVFVGYGVVAPEFDWDDYKGVDVKGKTLIMLVGDPPVSDPDDPDKLDDNVFGGRAMTYYGRWTYKFEIAAEKGAEACFVIHETEPAGYPWGVVRGTWSGEQFDLVSPDNNMSRCAVEGWLPFEQAKAVFQLTGANLPALKKSAIQRDFKPVPVKLSASLTINNSLRSLESRNVVAKLEGSDPELRDEYVIYTAHWDHFGRDASLEGDQIFNGAVDNATGVAGLMELARAFKKLPKPPRRSILFAAVTAEEQGLLGSKYYGENPIYPLVKTAAVINMDGLNIHGRTRDIIVIGLGNSTLDEVAIAVAGEQGRVVKPDAEPEKGMFYRSDHFSLSKKGVPALYTDVGIDYIGRPEGWGLEMRKKYTKENYHKPSDEYDPSWDLSGAVEDLDLMFEVGLRVANENGYPKWKAGTEFKALRERMLREAGVDGERVHGPGAAGSSRGL